MSADGHDIRQKVVSQIGEFGLIERIRLHLQDRTGHHPGGLHILGIGDDAALLRPPEETDLAVSTDIQIAGRHFLPSVMTPRQVGRRAMHVNLSDLAAMGAHPESLFVSLGLRPDMEVDAILEIYDGFLDALDGYEGAAVTGGNLTATTGPWFCDITAIGSLPRGQALRRSSAQAGDCIFVSGFPGSSAAGLTVLEQLLKTAPSAETQPTQAATDQEGSGQFGAERSRVAEWIDHHTWARSLVRAYLEPVARLELGRHLRERKLAHAVCDTSDGLFGDLQHICEASGISARLDAARLPRSEAMKAAARHFDKPGLGWILGASDDYELLFTAPPDARAEVLALGHELSVSIHLIGTCVAASEAITSIEVENLPAGVTPAAWDHFETRDG